MLARLFIIGGLRQAEKQANSSNTLCNGQEPKTGGAGGRSPKGLVHADLNVVIDPLHRGESSFCLGCQSDRKLEQSC